MAFALLTILTRFTEMICATVDHSDKNRNFILNERIFVVTDHSYGNKIIFMNESQLFSVYFPQKEKPNDPTKE